MTTYMLEEWLKVELHIQRNIYRNITVIAIHQKQIISFYIHQQIPHPNPKKIKPLRMEHIQAVIRELRPPPGELP